MLYLAGISNLILQLTITKKPADKAFLFAVLQFKSQFEHIFAH